VANAARATSVTSNRFEGRHGEARYGYRAAYAAGAYAAGVASGYAYRGVGYSSDGDCYYVYRRDRRVMLCE
jgi:hypothetical protein